MIISLVLMVLTGLLISIPAPSISAHSTHSPLPLRPVIKVTRPISLPTKSAPAPTPAPNPTPTPHPPVAVTAARSVDIKNYLMAAINDYRKSQGLGEVKTDPYTCDFAKTRAGEIGQNFNHDGFNSRADSNSLPYLSYSSITENIALNSSFKNVVSAWINSPGHAANMRADTPYVCVEKNGNYYAYEGWKP